MPPDPPFNLVLQDYQEILTALQLRIPGYTPEWTDWNKSDPGTTLLELFAFVGQSMGYRLNQVPAACYQKFVELIGLRPLPARPSVVYLSFTPTPASPAIPILVPQATAVSATGTDGRPVYFETDTGLSLTRFPLTAVQLFDGSTHGTGGGSFQPFGASPSPGNAVYLGFGPADPSITLPAFPAEIQLHVVVPPASGGAVSSDQIAAQPNPVPPVTVQWEYLDSTQPAEHWTRLNQYADTSVAFTRDGDIHIEGPPAQIQAQPGIGAFTDPYFWLRCRLTGGVYPTAPAVTQIQENTVSAASLRTVPGEPVGQSSGLPGQQLALANSPVDPATIQLTVTTGGQPPVLWTAQEDLFASSALATNYVLDANAGTVTFGDGVHGLIPPAGSDITATYRYGGGARDNVAAGAVSALQGPILGVSAVTNARAAAGGQDVQTTGDLQAKAPTMLRSQLRAVTAADFQAVAMRIPGVARVTVLPFTNPNFPGISVPGAVTVVIVPTVTAPGQDLPVPAPELTEAVARDLDSMRPVTAEVYVDGPVYRRVRVTARIEIVPSASPDTVSHAIVAALAAFLSPLPVPLSGGASSTPRDFGEDFYPTSLYRAMLDVENVVAVPILSVWVDGVQVQLTDTVTLDPNELLASAGDGSFELTVVPRSVSPAGPA
jgi:predicted phage baseplate assembly protein